MEIFFMYTVGGIGYLIEIKLSITNNLIGKRNLIICVVLIASFSFKIIVIIIIIIINGLFTREKKENPINKIAFF